MINRRERVRAGMGNDALEKLWVVEFSVSVVTKELRATMDAVSHVRCHHRQSYVRFIFSHSLLTIILAFSHGRSRYCKSLLFFFDILPIISPKWVWQTGLNAAVAVLSEHNGLPWGVMITLKALNSPLNLNYCQCTLLPEFASEFASMSTKQWFQIEAGNEIVMHFLLSLISSLDFKPKYLKKSWCSADI